MTRFKKKLYGSAFANQFVAKTMGQHSHRRQRAWIDGDKEYSHITGGIILPTVETPGFLVTIGVSSEGDRLDCLDEFESKDEMAIVDRAKGIQTEYGEGVITNWWGDAGKLMSIVNERNAENPVYISHPIDFQEKDAFEIYVARIKVALWEKSKMFYFMGCTKVRGYCIAFNQDRVASLRNNPIVGMVGWVIHTLLILRPWDVAYEELELIPTEPEEFAEYEQAKTMRDLEGEVWGEV